MENKGNMIVLQKAQNLHYNNIKNGDTIYFSKDGPIKLRLHNVNDKSTKEKIVSIHDVLSEVVDGHYRIYVKDFGKQYRELDGKKTVRENDLKNNQELVYGKSIC